ncbi:helix-turn-helix domain-containing protein [Rhodoferax sp. 4810]|nr:helix-turn-helix domain-containing protein [Rhodoferax jenense]
MTHHMPMPTPSGDELKAARLRAGLSQVEAATLMGYPVQSGSRGGQQSRTWQALESAQDPRNMAGSTYALFQLLTNSHPDFVLLKKDALAADAAATAPGQSDPKSV